MKRFNFRFITNVSPPTVLLTMFMIAWIIAIVFRPTKIPEDVLLNNLAFLWGLIILCPLLFTYYLGYRDILKSPVISWIGGHDTLAVSKPIGSLEFPPRKGKPTFKYPFEIFPNGSFKLLWWPSPGGGVKGYKLVLGVPGMIDTRGENVSLNTKRFVTYLPDYMDKHRNHTKLGFLYLNLKNQMISDGRPWSDDARVDVAIIPCEQLLTALGLDEDAWDDLVDVEEIIGMYNERISAQNNSLEEARESKELAIATIQMAKGQAPQNTNNNSQDGSVK